MEIRLRLTLLYGLLFLVCGALLLAITYAMTVYALPALGIRPPAPPDVTLPFSEPMPPEVRGPGSVVQRAEDRYLLLVASGIAIGIMTVVSVGLGWWMAGRLLRPLRAMTTTAQEISAHNLHRRLDVRGPDDEIKGLADTVDGLLDRLEAAFEAQRRFAANASHELRTPLTFERSLLEVALADPDATAADLRAACERVLRSNRHQERLVEALLTLTRGQRGLERRDDVNLEAIAGHLIEEARSGAGGVHLEADLNPATVAGDARLVERLLANLLDNAVRYNVADGWVSVWTGDQDGRPTLRVRNAGPLVPPDRAGALFEPFRRGDGARTGDEGGVGLGLSIVTGIATAHDAELDAIPRPEGGLDVRVSFP